MVFRPHSWYLLAEHGTIHPDHTSPVREIHGAFDCVRGILHHQMILTLADRIFMQVEGVKRVVPYISSNPIKVIPTGCSNKTAVEIG